MERADISSVVPKLWSKRAEGPAAMLAIDGTHSLYSPPSLKLDGLPSLPLN